MTTLITDDLVEMVARALCATAGGNPDAPLCAGGNALWLRYRGDARAALAVAVPRVAEACARIPDAMAAGSGAVRTREALEYVAMRIRSLTKVQP